MTDFTLEGFIAKLTEMTIALHDAEDGALERAAHVVEREAKSEITHLGGTGELGDSIEYTIIGRRVYIGSNSEIAECQELGTNRLPPQSFLGSALVNKADEVVKVVQESVVDALDNRKVVGGTLPVTPD